MVYQKINIELIEYLLNHNLSQSNDEITYIYI